MLNNKTIELLKEIEEEYLNLINLLINQEQLNKTTNNLRIKIENIQKKSEEKNINLGTNSNYNKTLMDLKNSEDIVEKKRKEITTEFAKMKDLILNLNCIDIKNLTISLKDLEDELQDTDKTINANTILIKYSIEEKEIDVLKLALDCSIDLINEEENDSIDLLSHHQNVLNINFLNMFVEKYQDFLKCYRYSSEYESISKIDYSTCHDSLYEDINLYNSMYSTIKNKITKKINISSFEGIIKREYDEWRVHLEYIIYKNKFYKIRSSSRIRLENIERMKEIMEASLEVDKEIPKSLFLK